MRLSPRICLIHAIRVSIDPINDAFARQWPEARIHHLLDDSLSPDLHDAGAITPAIKSRFVRLAQYAQDCGAEAILFTCSAFGTAIDLVKQVVSVPVLKPNEAMIEDAIRGGSRIGLLTTARPAIVSMVPEFEQAARAAGRPVQVVPCFVDGAMAALQAGRAGEHDERIAEAAKGLGGCDALALAQFSMARARDRVAAASGQTVHTTPDSAVAKLRTLLLNTAGHAGVMGARQA